MPVLRSRLDTGSAEYAADREAMLAALERVDEVAATVLAAGGGEPSTRHRERGKLLARERIELLLDADAPFLELSPLAGGHARRPRPAPGWSPASGRCRASSA